jgi:hypothetical protein
MPTLLESISSLGLNEVLTLLISAGSLLVSAITLIVGWAAYKKFLNQKLAESQLTVVLAFVEALYQSTFYISIIRHRGSTISTSLIARKNLFQLSTSGKGPYTGAYHDIPVLVSSSQLGRFKGWEFMKNPLLPNAISKELYALGRYCDLKEVDLKSVQEYIVIGEITDNDDDTILKVQARGGYAGFIECCSALDLAIKLWLKRHGLHDLNQHVVNTSSFRSYTKQEYYDIDKEDYERYQAAKLALAEAVQTLADKKPLP